jgi:hypothetical protein
MPGTVQTHAATKATAIHKVLLAVIVRGSFAFEYTGTAAMEYSEQLLRSDSKWAS